MHTSKYILIHSTVFLDLTIYFSLIVILDIDYTQDKYASIESFFLCGQTIL